MAALPCFRCNLNRGTKVEIEGKIIEVMESQPIQLLVECSGQRYSVNLLEDTRLQRANHAVDPGTLSPGMKIRIIGNESLPEAMVAAEIEIIG